MSRWPTIRACVACGDTPDLRRSSLGGWWMVCCSRQVISPPGQTKHGAIIRWNRYNQATRKRLRQKRRERAGKSTGTPGWIARNVRHMARERARLAAQRTAPELVQPEPRVVAVCESEHGIGVYVEGAIC